LEGNICISESFKFKEEELNFLHTQPYDETLTVFIVGGPTHSSSFYLPSTQRDEQISFFLRNLI